MTNQMFPVCKTDSDNFKLIVRTILTKQKNLSYQSNYNFLWGYRRTFGLKCHFLFQIKWIYLMQLSIKQTNRKYEPNE